MPDSRKHRGPHPRDPALFAPAAWPSLRQACQDLSWLLERGYAPDASLKLVGDRFQLALRQRQAVARCACGSTAVTHRRHTRVGADALRGRPLWIDGFNVLTTLEVALSGGLVLRGRDGCLRDIAGVHGTWRRVEETGPALSLLVSTCAELGLSGCRVLLDRPVSNSGRLRRLLVAESQQSDIACQVDLVDDPDRVLVAAGDAVVASSDREVLAACSSWFDLAGVIVETRLPRAWLVDLSS